VKSAAAKSEEVAGSAILRVDKSAGRWEAVPRQLIEDHRLELDTRALAVWLIARPEGWEIRAGALPQLLKNRSKHVGRERVQRMLRELENSGYLTRSCHRTAGGRWRWHAVFSLIPRRLTVDGLAVNGPAVDGSTVDGSAVNGKPVDIKHTEEDNTVRNNTRDQTILNKTAPESGGVAIDSESSIDLPECLRGPQRAAAKKLLVGCPVADRQSVLDEIAAMDAQGRVRRPLGLLRKLLENATAGTFTPRAAQRGQAQSGEPRAIQRGGRNAGQPIARPEEAHVIANRALAKLRAKHCQAPNPTLGGAQMEGEPSTAPDQCPMARMKKDL
jgi:hypothetical protein